jgi:hypothetical protein
MLRGMRQWALLSFFSQLKLFPYHILHNFLLFIKPNTKTLRFSHFFWVFISL